MFASPEQSLPRSAVVEQGVAGGRSALRVSPTPPFRHSLPLTLAFAAIGDRLGYAALGGPDDRQGTDRRLGRCLSVPGGHACQMRPDPAATTLPRRSKRPDRLLAIRPLTCTYW
jgi:hypothetical protein